jgi:hypothetical protein
MSQSHELPDDALPPIFGKGTQSPLELKSDETPVAAETPSRDEVVLICRAFVVLRRVV